MKLQNSRAQIIPVEMRIYFCGGNAFMPQHFLHSAEVSATFYQMSCKRMTEGMRAYPFFNSANFQLVFDDIKNHHACKLGAPAVKKNKIFKTRFNRQMVAVRIYIYIQLFNSSATNRDYSFFISFADYFQQALIKERR